jgi:hypothetical protein
MLPKARTVKVMLKVVPGIFAVTTIASVKVKVESSGKLGV